MAQEKPGKKVIAQNREAHHEYFVIEALEPALNWSAPRSKACVPAGST